MTSEKKTLQNASPRPRLSADGGANHILSPASHTQQRASVIIAVEATRVGYGPALSGIHQP